MKSWQSGYDQIFQDHHSSIKFHVNEAELAESLKEWLARLSLLHGLPFNYLVPDEKMLPMESIRFFYIDPNWVHTMIDGAMSVSRLTSHDLEHDSQVIDLLYKLANEGSRKQSPDEGDVEEAGVRTGFFLRSTLLINWPGFHIKGFSADHTPLELLRVDRLASDTLLCIMEGELETVELHQPGMGVHFGLDVVDGEYWVELRRLKADSNEDKKNFGEVIMKKKVQIPMRNSRVVDVEKLVSRLDLELQHSGESNENFTSAEFAVQMIEGVDVCVFKREKK